MKSLQQMHNVEKGKLLADLLPTELPNITFFIACEARRFLRHEEQIKSQWTATLVTGDFWFNLVRNIDQTIKKHGNKLHKNHRWFSDQLFDGYDALFTLYCLVEYAAKAECNYRLQYGVYMLFGNEKLILTTLNDTTHG